MPIHPQAAFFTITLPFDGMGQMALEFIRSYRSALEAVPTAVPHVGNYTLNLYGGASSQVGRLWGV